jgi:hypothetical protein
MWFDGLGTFKFHDTADLGGFVIQRGTADNPIVGTYTVNPDGTGTMQWFSNGSNHAGPSPSLTVAGNCSSAEPTV